MLFQKIILTVLLLAFPLAAAQASKCYTPEQFESEQGIRIHSELMVIGLTCQKVRGGESLYNKYRRFTNKNQYLLSLYEDTIMAYYRSNGSDPEKALHHLRTNIANEISQKAIRMDMGAFCDYYKGRIDRALAMDHDTLRRWARQQWPTQPPTQPLCSSY